MEGIENTCVIACIIMKKKTKTFTEFCIIIMLLKPENYVLLAGMFRQRLNGQLMAEYLGDPATAGDKLKEAGTAHWQNIFSKATNDYDFTGLPGGMRFYTGVFPEFE